jgi:CBS domain-containing protein
VKISDILRHKQSDRAGSTHGGHTGSAVATITADDPVTGLLAELAEHGVGALVVIEGTRVIGMVSERDVVRTLHDRGAPMLTERVGQIMTTEVLSCTSHDSVDDVAATMTERRVRHMPVIDDGELVGIVSIGDVVLSRIRQLEQDRGQLEQYITG